MKVNLIDYTGAGFPEEYAANQLIYAKSTRLTQGEELLSKIKNMKPEERRKELVHIANSVRSSWEFVRYTWQIEDVTRAFTHQMVRSRHFSFAQQAMRVADMSNFEALIPDSVEANPDARDTWDDIMEFIHEAYPDLIKLGIPTEDARGILPTNTLTNILASCNLRSLAELIGKRDNLRAQGEYVKVIRKMAETVVEVHPWAEIFLYPPRTQTPALDAILADRLNGRPPVELPEVNDALKELDRVKAVWG